MVDLNASGPLAGLFYGLGVRSGKRFDSFCEIPRDELDGEDCKAKERAPSTQTLSLSQTPDPPAQRDFFYLQTLDPPDLRPSDLRPYVPKQARV